jgi:hypothetical protein
MSQKRTYLLGATKRKLKKEAVERGKKGQTDKSNWFKTQDSRMVHKGKWMLTICLRILHPLFPRAKIKEITPL